jgi:hypothetical protein
MIDPVLIYGKGTAAALIWISFSVVHKIGKKSDPIFLVMRNFDYDA